MTVGFWNLHDRSITIASKQIVLLRCPVCNTYFLWISTHLYLPCWGRSLDLQKIRKGGFVSTAFRVTINLSKHTTTTSTANYRVQRKRNHFFPFACFPLTTLQDNRPESSLMLTPRTTKQPQSTEIILNPWGQRDPWEWEEGSRESPSHLTETWSAAMNGVKWELSSGPSPHARVSSTLLPFILFLSPDLPTHPAPLCPAPA